MATSLLWLTTVLMVTLTTLNHSCSGASPFNKNAEIQPQTMVEIIKLMLSKTPNISEQAEFGIQKVPQEDSPNYEILITPNKNLQELKGSQKIKIFVEAANYEGDKHVSEVKKPETEKQSSFDVLPLSIETIGLNIQDYQQKGIQTVKLNGQSDDLSSKDSYSESYPSKRQTSWGFVPQTGNVRQPEIQTITIQKEPSYVDQNNPHQPVSTPKKDDRQRTPVYETEYSSPSQNNKRPKQTYEDDSSSLSGEPIRTRPSSKDYTRNYETSYPDTYEEVRHTNDRRQTGGDIEIRPSNDRRQTVGDIEVRPSNDRRQTFVREEEYFRPSESRNPGYREPEYEKEVRPTNERPVYVRPEEVRPNNERRPISRPSDERNPSRDRRKDYESDYNERPVTTQKDTGYAGFPESHQPDINNHYFRPLQFDSPRAYPASPCHNVFKYEGREPEEDRWYADIYVTTDEILTGMRLDITLDKPAELLTNWVAEVKSEDSTHFTILSLTHKLIPGPAETVRIMVKFNEKKPVPFLKSIHLNGRMICPNNRAQKITTKKPVYEYPGDLQSRRTTTERYQEAPKQPFALNGEYETQTKRTERTTPVYEEPKRATSRPTHEVWKPNPNGYEETNLNNFNQPTKRPPGRPEHSNGKPPPHAAKPANPKPGNGPPGHSNNKPGNGPPPKKPNGKPVRGGNQGSKPAQSGNQGNKPVQTGNQGNKPSHQGNKPPIPTSAERPTSGELLSQSTISCGTPSIQPSPLIIHGQPTTRGQWPWHVGLYRTETGEPSFFCGGSLINKNHILTAAHCVAKPYTTKPIDENSLIVYLGKYRRCLWAEEGTQLRQVANIVIHPRYNSTDFRSDIAVLTLSAPVEYSNYIRPICLWDKSNTQIENLEGKLGTVVGWGYDENLALAEELRTAKLPIVEQKTCLWSNPEFFPQFTSNMTFCAGFKNGTSPCNGDSGGGMVFPFKDRNGKERWYLRGIVSISPAMSNARICDPTYYVVFTDAAKYLDWLEEVL